MKKWLFVLMIMYSGVAMAQYGQRGNIGPVVVPFGTTRIQQNYGGNTFYGPNGLNGRSYNTGNGQMIYNRVNGQTKYQGRTFYNNIGGMRYQPPATRK